MDFISWCRDNRAFETFLRSHLSNVDLWILRVVCKEFRDIIPKQPKKTVNILTAARGRHLGGLKTLCKDRHPKRRSSLCLEAARGGSIEILEWLKEKNFCTSYGHNMFYVAAQEGQLEAFKWCYNNFENNALELSSTGEAATNGHLEILKWLKENDYFLGRGVCGHAAIGGQLEILKWLRENDDDGYDWNCVCYCAAVNGHLEVLKWARENGCLWGPSGNSICKIATKQGHFEIVNWAKANGCPFEPDQT